jgi:WD40 repeat protein
VVLGLHNNALELWDVPAALMLGKGDSKAQEAKKSDKKNASDKAALLKEEKDAVAGAYRRVSTIELPGHRSDIRSVSFSSDDSLLLSTSSGMLCSTLTAINGSSPEEIC